MSAEKSQLRYLSILFILSCCALLLSARLVYLYLDNGSAFPIKTIKVTAAYNHIEKKQLEELLSQYGEVSFFTLPVNQLEQQILGLDWASSVVIERQWPDTVLVTLVEKDPIAFWNNAMITKEGELFNVNKKIEDKSLPNLIGPEAQQTLVLQVYEKLSKILTIYSLHVSTLELRPNSAWELTLSNGIIIRLGKRDLTLRIKRFCNAYKAVFGETIKDSSEQLIVDLRYPRGMAVQWKNKREDNG